MNAKDRMRVVQGEGRRGSLKWIQGAVNQSSGRALSDLIAPTIGDGATITWLSPRVDDDFAEYRDASFLKLIGAASLVNALEAFWPIRGPQWDALGRSDRGDILLVEAKAHIREICSPPSQATSGPRSRIEAALAEASSYLGARPRAPWIDVFYQLANRIAHLYFLRRNGEKAWLVLANFVGDQEMHGPNSPAEWEAAYQVVWHVLGLQERHPLARYIIHVYPIAK
jgi:hypothetical protein